MKLPKIESLGSPKAQDRPPLWVGLKNFGGFRGDLIPALLDLNSRLERIEMYLAELMAASNPDKAREYMAEVAKDRGNE